MTRDYTTTMSARAKLVDLIETLWPRCVSWIEYKEIIEQNGFDDHGNIYAYVMSLNLETWISDIIDHVTNGEFGVPEDVPILEKLLKRAKVIDPAPLNNWSFIGEACLTMANWADNDVNVWNARQELQCSLLGEVK